jgi:hypothetical protein
MNECTNERLNDDNNNSNNNNDDDDNDDNDDDDDDNECTAKLRFMNFPFSFKKMILPSLARDMLLFLPGNDIPLGYSSRKGL